MSHRCNFFLGNRGSFMDWQPCHSSAEGYGFHQINYFIMFLYFRLGSIQYKNNEQAPIHNGPQGPSRGILEKFSNFFAKYPLLLSSWCTILSHFITR